MNNEIYNTIDTLIQYVELEALREEVNRCSDREVELTISIPNTGLSYTGYFPQVTAHRMLLYKSNSLKNQIIEFQKNEEVFE